MARLAADSRLGLSAADLDAILAEPLSFTGAADDQVAHFLARAEEITKTWPDAAAYVPATIL
jgi:adenylosuccinate lyase